MDFNEIYAEHNESHQAAFENGTLAGDRFNGEWRSWVHQPTVAEVKRNRFAWSELFTLLQPLFGRGNNLKYTDLAAYEMFLHALRHGLGFSLDRDDLREDNIGLYDNVSYDLAQGARTFPWLRFWDLLTGPAFTGAEGFVSFDNTTLISDAHPYRDEGGVTRYYSNRGTWKFSRIAYELALVAIDMFRRPQGQFLPPDYDIHVVVGPKYRAAALNLFESVLIGGGNTNTVRKPRSWTVSKRLTGDFEDYWFIFVDWKTPTAKPLLYREDQAPVLVADMSLTSEAIWTANEFRWRVEQKFGFAPGKPWALWASDGTEDPPAA